MERDQASGCPGGGDPEWLREVVPRNCSVKYVAFGVMMMGSWKFQKHDVGMYRVNIVVEKVVSHPWFRSYM